MSEQSSRRARAPRTFDLDGLTTSGAEDDIGKSQTRAKAKAKPAKAKTARKPRVVHQAAVMKPVPDEAAQRTDPVPLAVEQMAADLTPPPPLKTKRRWSWSRLFLAALAGLASLAIGIWVDQLIRDLFARQDWLGWLAVSFTALLVLAALAIVLREFLGLMRMARIQGLRTDGEKASSNNDAALARKTIGALITLYEKRPDTARGRKSLSELDGEIVDGRDMIHLAERDLLRPLDEQARALVMGSSKRVSVVTAVSPRAVVDLAFVLMENIRLVRRIADLYGGRPGTIGFWRLARNVLAHLAVTGSIAVGDGLLQQVVGHGLAAKISTRLGEGIVNGLLTARIGIAAIDVCRPLPFADQHRPGVSDFLSELVKSSPKEE